MLVWLDTIPPKQAIKAFPFDPCMGCRFCHLPIVTAQDLLEVAPGSLSAASRLSLRPRK